MTITELAPRVVTSQRGIGQLMRLEPFPVPKRQVAKMPEQRRGVLVVGATTVSRDAFVPRDTLFQPHLTDLSPVERRHISLNALRETQDQLERAGMQFQPPVYGNAAEIGRRLDRLLNDGGLEGKTTPVRIITWADQNKQELEAVLSDSAGNLTHTIYEAKGSMPQALAYAVETESGIERVIYSTSPDVILLQDIDIAEGGLPEQVIVTSLPKQAFLRRLTQKLADTNTPYTYIPGAVRISGDIEAVYKAAEKAASLVVTEDELKTLIEGKGRTPADKYKLLLRQGLDLLGPTSLFVTLNSGGALGAQGTNMLEVAATPPVHYINGDSYRDAFAAGIVSGIVTEKSLEDRLCRGSMSASFVTQIGQEGEHIPSEFDFLHRSMELDGNPEIKDLTKS